MKMPSFPFSKPALILGAFLLMDPGRRTNVATAEIDVYAYFPDFPGFRFTIWEALPPSVQTLAETAGYDQQTWDNVGTAPMEDQAWYDLNDAARQALRTMGFTEGTWDCYMNHYTTYSWLEMVVADKHYEVEILGYTPEVWDSQGAIAADDLDWVDLSDGQQRAAAELCYFSHTWDGGLALDDMVDIPKRYPWFRFQPWEYLTSAEQTFATSVGWDEATWNKADSNLIAAKPFYKLTDQQLEDLFKLGFYEDQYDCYINHYEGYTWTELQDYGLATHFEAFGFTETSYLAQEQPDAYVNADWKDLTDDQQSAAKKLCWFQEIWDDELIPDWDDEVVFPSFFYKPWTSLRYSQQLLAALLGYDRTAWNTPGTHDLEKMRFGDLPADQQDALQGLGFYSVAQYDCYVNHYNGYSWDELIDAGLDRAAQSLGWTESSWNGDDADPPKSDSKDWDDLSEDEKEAADKFCYFFELWDQAPLDIWKGIAWPELRYYPWSNMDDSEKDLLTEVGWTESTWNTPKTASFEKTSWSDLSGKRQDLLMIYGFYEDQWDCYVAHYYDYDWYELVLAGVSEYFAAFGWTQASWDADEPPSAWTRDWDELSETQQDAAKGICFFRETWDKLELSKWDESDRSGNLYGDYEDDDDDYYYDDDEDADFSRASNNDNDKTPLLVVGVSLLTFFVGMIMGVCVGRKKAPRSKKVVDMNSNITATRNSVAVTDAANTDLPSFQFSDDGDAVKEVDLSDREIA